MTGLVHIFVAFSPRSLIHKEDCILCPHKITLHVVHKVTYAVVVEQLEFNTLVGNLTDILVRKSSCHTGEERY